MGWENYLGPNHSGEAPTDFEIHRAQMRHYDDYMAQYDSSGGSLSSSYGGESTGRGGGHLLLAGPNVMLEVSDGRRFKVRSSELPEKSDVDGTFDNMDLTQVMQPEVTAGKMFGLTWEANPFFSDVEEWAEKRYGDIGGALAAPIVFAGDFGWNVARIMDHYSGGYMQKPLTEIGQDIQGALSPSAAPMFNMHSTTVSPDGAVWRTGGGF